MPNAYDYLIVGPGAHVQRIVFDGRRAADASVMPSLPAANTYFPTMMIAEKIAAAVVSGE